MSGATLGDFIKFLERAVPLELAEEWDRSGLQTGDPAQEVSRILVALDPTKTAVLEAAGRKANLLVTHHPLLMNPLKSLDTSDPTAAIASLLIKNSIALYSCHTNFDRVEGGVNDALASALNLTNLRLLTPGEEALKVVVTAPGDSVEVVVDAIAGASGGTIGKYERCAYHSDGVGTFTPREGSNSFIGAPGRTENVKEARIEATVPKSRLSGVVAAVRAVHPYEEPVIDVYRLSVRATTGGLGRIGELERDSTLGAFSAFVAQKLDAGALRIVGDDRRNIRTVAVCGGSGASLWRAARAGGADVLVTGDVKHHDAVDALEAGFALVDAGHSPTERAALPALAETVRRTALAAGLKVKVEIFTEKEPFTTI